MASDDVRGAIVEMYRHLVMTRRLRCRQRLTRKKSRSDGKCLQGNWTPFKCCTNVRFGNPEAGILSWLTMSFESHLLTSMFCILFASFLAGAWMYHIVTRCYYWKVLLPLYCDECVRCEEFCITTYGWLCDAHSCRADPSLTRSATASAVLRTWTATQWWCYCCGQKAVVVTKTKTMTLIAEFQCSGITARDDRMAWRSGSGYDRFRTIFMQRQGQTALAQLIATRTILLLHTVNNNEPA